jgi:hypothetical protein
VKQLKKKAFWWPVTKKFFVADYTAANSKKKKKKKVLWKKLSHIIGTDFLEGFHTFKVSDQLALQQHIFGTPFRMRAFSSANIPATQLCQ